MSSTAPAMPPQGHALLQSPALSAVGGNNVHVVAARLAAASLPAGTDSLILITAASAR
jgi:hypothetical protein